MDNGLLSGLIPAPPTLATMNSNGNLRADRSRSQQREILRLAVPAFLALVAEPLFLLADSAIIGHLGTTQLAGLGVASAALITAANIFVFLAYGTTSIVARQVGAGSERGAVSAGIDGLWLAIAIGLVTGALVAGFAAPLCALFGASPAALAQAVTYLRVSAIGIPAMLVALAVTGVLRGLQDTRTPLVASVIGFTANIALNLPGLFSGAVVTEAIFSWPGMGQLFFQALSAYDYPLLMGILFVSACLVVIFNFLADIAYAVVDPRIRLQ